MTLDLTAVVLSPEPAGRGWSGLVNYNHVSRFDTPGGFTKARFASIQGVTTKWFVWVDSDDDLPADYLDVFSECMAVDCPIAYTDEEVRESHLTYRRTSEPYDRRGYIERPAMIHHAAVCRTADARRVLPTLPEGDYWPEMLLYHALANLGAHYVPRVGYIWNKGQGMHTKPESVIAVARTAAWCWRNP